MRSYSSPENPTGHPLWILLVSKSVDNWIFTSSSNTGQETVTSALTWTDAEVTMSFFWLFWHATGKASSGSSESCGGCRWTGPVSAHHSSQQKNNTTHQFCYWKIWIMLIHFTHTLLHNTCVWSQNTTLHCTYLTHIARVYSYRCEGFKNTTLLDISHWNKQIRWSSHNNVFKVKVI